MNDIEEVMFSRIIENDKKIYWQNNGDWNWFKIILIGFTIILIMSLLGI